MRLNPYLQFDGNCADAFAFYAEAFRGTIVMMMKAADSPMADQVPPERRDDIIHARLAVGGDQLMGSDAMGSSYAKPAGFHVTLSPTDPAEAERVFAALADGGTVQMPIAETFWATRFGVVVDRFGTPWMVNCERQA